MKTRPLKNYGSSVGVEVYDIDLQSDDEILELGRLVADQCVVFIDQAVTTERLVNIQSQWGDPNRAIIHNYIAEGKLRGPHWREILLHLGFIAKEVKNLPGASMVSYQTDENNRPRGIFTNGELNWHADQVSIDDAPRMIGLHSVSDSENSQTEFLCTHDFYESLSSDMRSMIKELVCRHYWDVNTVAPGLNYIQGQIIHYNGIPLDGLETSFYSETANGRPGIKFPNHSFDGFVGMSREESFKLFNELYKSLFQDKYVYTQDWKDGQLVFMDQEITLHRRPTNIQAGNKRTMARVISYMNHIYPKKAPSKYVRFKGQLFTHDEFAKLVDEDRKKAYAKELEHA